MGHTLLTADNFHYIFKCVTDDVRDTYGDKGNALCAKLEKGKDAMYENYTGIREMIKVRYMQDPDGPLDRHKCAAAFMATFLNGIDQLENDISREKLAISIGLLILKIFINTNNKNYSDAGMVTYIDEYGFGFPTCTRDDGKYMHNWALGIYYDSIDNKLSIITLANVLFLIEAHNRKLAKDSQQSGKKTC